MASLQDQLSRLVYSTEKGDLCPDCGEALTACICSEQAEQTRIAAMDGVVRIRRETSGRTKAPDWNNILMAFRV